MPRPPIFILSGSERTTNEGVRETVVDEKEWGLASRSRIYVKRAKISLTAPILPVSWVVSGLTLAVARPTTHGSGAFSHGG